MKRTQRERSIYEGEMHSRTRWIAVFASLIAVGGGITLAGVATSQEQESPQIGSPWNDPFNEFNWPDRFTRADKIATLEKVLAHKRESLAELERGLERGEFTGENGDDPYDLVRQEIAALQNMIAKLEEYLAAQQL
jgi:hypothetical protein